MGNCFGKNKNKVGPDPQERRGDISAVISAGNPFQQPSPSVSYPDMEAELKKGEEMVAVLEKEQDAKVNKGGVAFAVTLDGKPSNTVAPPRRLPPLPPRTLGGAHQPTITYTGEEDQLMAEILRDDFLSERRARARKCQGRGAAQAKGNSD